MKTRDEHGWQWLAEFTERSVSYSYCPECLEEFRDEAGYTQRDVTHRAKPGLVFAYA